jgi:hypothetical protein
MKPEHETRRKIIREWMSLPKDKRQTEEQAKLFAKKAMEQIPSSGDPYRQIMKWLLPRIDKPGPGRQFVSFGASTTKQSQPPQSSRFKMRFMVDSMSVDRCTQQRKRAG